MTTEIAVMNRMAVALAADSAGTVTLSSVDDNEETHKIYFSENKLFALSKYHPVGIMVYGNADFMTVPLEIIIKEYRQVLGKQQFDTLQEYAIHFIDYVEKQDRYFTDDLKERFYIYSAYQFLMGINELIADAKKDAKKRKQKFSIQKAIESFHKTANGIADLPNIPKSKTQQILKKYEKQTKKVVKEAISTKLSAAETNKLIEMCALMITKKTEFPGSYAGVVIAGYGKNEFYPSIESYRLYGTFDDFLRFYREEEKCDKVDHDNNASVMAFAQGHVVSTFMEGIDPKYRETLLSTVNKMMSQTTAQILGKLSGKTAKEKKDIEKELAEHSKKLMEELIKKMQTYQAKYHSNRIVTNVEFLSKDALAEVAETLVNITSFKIRSSMLLETVGG